jgi:hypothetical protein
VRFSRHVEPRRKQFNIVLVDMPRFADRIGSLGVSEISSRRRGAKAIRRRELLFKTDRSRFFTVTRDSRGNGVLWSFRESSLDERGQSARGARRSAPFDVWLQAARK